MEYCEQTDGWLPLGFHRYRVSDSILWFESHGEFTKNDVDEYAVILDRLLAINPGLGILADVRGGISSTIEVRKHASEVLRAKSRGIPIAIVGANMTIRTVYTLFAKAQQLIWGTPSSNACFTNLSDGKAWIERQVADRGRAQATAC